MAVLSHAFWMRRFGGHDFIVSTMVPVTDEFIETMAIALRDGRSFARSDMAGARATVVVVNEALANRYVGRGERAVGRTFETCFFRCDIPIQYEIVGVVADTRHDLRKPAKATIYIPIALRSSGAIHVRVAGDVQASTAMLRQVVNAATPLLPATTITPQSTVVAQTLLRERLLALLSGSFAVIGLALAAIGWYGDLTYSVVQRTREIGIRLALGAQPLGVVRSIVADAGMTTLAGIAAGLAGGLYLSRFVTALLFEVTPLDASSLVPAWRAARVDPVVALRHE